MLSDEWVRRRLPGLVIVALSLSGCVAAPPETVLVVPDLPVWSAADQTEVADELSACADCDAIERALGAYIGLRDAVRAVR